LSISCSGYYAWVKKPKSKRAIKNEDFLFNIRIFFNKSKGTYGSPCIYKEMEEAMFNIGLERIARIMGKADLKDSRVYKKQYKQSIKENDAAPNIINQDFKAEVPNRKWVTDIIQIRTYEVWLYLAMVCDLYSRMIIGWSMRNTLTNKPVLYALLMAVLRRRHSNYSFGSRKPIYF